MCVRVFVFSQPVPADPGHTRHTRVPLPCAVVVPFLNDVARREPSVSECVYFPRTMVKVRKISAHAAD